MRVACDRIREQMSAFLHVGKGMDGTGLQDNF